MGKLVSMLFFAIVGLFTLMWIVVRGIFVFVISLFMALVTFGAAAAHARNEEKDRQKQAKERDL